MIPYRVSRRYNNDKLATLGTTMSYYKLSYIWTQLDPIVPLVGPVNVLIPLPENAGVQLCNVTPAYC